MSTSPLSSLLSIPSLLYYVRPLAICKTFIYSESSEERTIWEQKFLSFVRRLSLSRRFTFSLHIQVTWPQSYLQQGICQSSRNRGARHGLEITCVYSLYRSKPYIKKMKKMVESLTSKGIARILCQHQTYQVSRIARESHALSASSRSHACINQNRWYLTHLPFVRRRKQCLHSLCFLGGGVWERDQSPRPPFEAG